MLIRDLEHVKAQSHCAGRACAVASVWNSHSVRILVYISEYTAGIVVMRSACLVPNSGIIVDPVIEHVCNISHLPVHIVRCCGSCCNNYRICFIICIVKLSLGASFSKALSLIQKLLRSYIADSKRIHVVDIIC